MCAIPRTGGSRAVGNVAYAQPCDFDAWDLFALCGAWRPPDTTMASASATKSKYREMEWDRKVLTGRIAAQNAPPLEGAVMRAARVVVLLKQQEDGGEEGIRTLVGLFGPHPISSRKSPV